MSNEINHEGKTYILKSQVEGIIKDRISKIASKASEAERRANELETSLAEISNKTASLDVIAQQLEEMKGKLSASENRFERYQAVSKYGITEPDIIEAIEYSYEKSMKNKAKKDQVALDAWISNHLESPNEAPVLLRPHLVQVAASRAPQEAKTEPENISSSPLSVEKNQPVQNLVSHNQNTVKAPEKQNIINQGLKDGKFYRESREAIMQAWLNQSKR